MKRGDIWLADLSPRDGTSPGKTRPVLLVQNQTLLDASHSSTLIVPLTTRLVVNAEPLRLRVQAKEQLDHPSDLLLDQLRALDNSRLLRGPLLHLSEDFMQQVDTALYEILGMELYLA